MLSYDKKAVVRQLLKAAFDAEANTPLSEDAAEAAVEVASLGLETKIADGLWPLPDGLPL